MSICHGAENASVSKNVFTVRELPVPRALCNPCLVASIAVVLKRELVESF